ncbi:MAG: tryptophan synthase subunit alpha [Polyangiaceae bacterium]|nr:tryptophan synthase subunit alpha [Polyangiaceae bacterium]MCW5791656.1 tryptophan synthase subunit alpha [Polyangiaceae bacterium]
MTRARLEQTFARLAEARRAALVAFLTTGDPSVAESADAARALLRGGVDILELGVPFSDPTADGPTIAEASARAIQRGGSLRATLGVAQALRAEFEAPIVLFTYYNPILAFGEQAFVEAAAAAGVDAVLIVDLPPEEGAGLRAALAQAELCVVPLLTPVSDSARECAALQGARGFVYYVSVTGVTGSAAQAPGAEHESSDMLSHHAAAGRAARALAERSGLPVVVGFGIDSVAKARAVVEAGASGVVVGSQLVRLIAEEPHAAAREAKLSAWARELRAVLSYPD